MGTVENWREFAENLCCSKHKKVLTKDASRRSETAWDVLDICFVKYIKNKHKWCVWGVGVNLPLVAKIG